MGVTGGSCKYYTRLSQGSILWRYLKMKDFNGLCSNMTRPKLYFHTCTFFVPLRLKHSMNQGFHFLHREVSSPDESDRIGSINESGYILSNPGASWFRQCPPTVRVVCKVGNLTRNPFQSCKSRFKTDPRRERVTRNGPGDGAAAPRLTV